MGLGEDGLLTAGLAAGRHMDSQIDGWVGGEGRNDQGPTRTGWLVDRDGQTRGGRQDRKGGRGGVGAPLCPEVVPTDPLRPACGEGVCVCVCVQTCAVFSALSSVCVCVEL